MLDQFLKIAKFLLISIKMYVFIELHDGIMDRVLDIQAKCRMIESIPVLYFFIYFI